MSRTDIYIALSDFVIRVANGGGKPEEVAILPAIANMLLIQPLDSVFPQAQNYRSGSTEPSDPLKYTGGSTNPPNFY